MDMNMNETSLNDKPVASSAPSSFPPFFRGRTLGRAPSPPTWACYEQIPPQASDSDEDEVQTASDSQSGSDSEGEDSGNVNDSSSNDEWKRQTRQDSLCEDMEMSMDIGEPDHTDTVSGSKMAVDRCRSGDGDYNDGENEAERACGSPSEQYHSDGCEDEQQRVKRVDKGKQRAVDPAPATEEKEKSSKRRHRRRKHHEPPFVYRPILTIKKSEGFVWNQDLFVPSYIKDRYIASISPSSAEFSCSMSPVPASEFNDNYEIEVVEIRVQGNELEGIIS